MLQKAAERKINDEKIPPEGEYIDENTIKRDFPTITQTMSYIELIVYSENSDSNKSKINQILNELLVGDFIIVTRSRETFSLYKIRTEQFLVIDSHQPFHGLIETNENVVKYLLLNDIYIGNLDIGYSQKS